MIDYSAEIFVKISPVVISISASAVRSGGISVGISEIPCRFSFMLVSFGEVQDGRAGDSIRYFRECS